MNKFEGYTQLLRLLQLLPRSCFIRMSMNKFEGYTQLSATRQAVGKVVLSGCQ